MLYSGIHYVVVATILLRENSIKSAAALINLEKMTYPTYDFVLEVGKYMILYHLRCMTLGA